MLEVSWNQTTYMDYNEITEQMDCVDMAQRFIKLCELAAPGKRYQIQNLHIIS